MAEKGGPKGPFIAVSVMYMSNALAETVLLPFAPLMVASFHVTTDEARLGYYAGLLASAFYFGMLLSSSAWGALSDSLGRKPVLLLGLLNNAVCAIAFGLSRSLPAAMAARFANGLFTGIYPVGRTTMSELCSSRTQASGFSLLSLSWGLGLLLGPAIGGTLADPRTKYPHWVPPSSLFASFPFLLPLLLLSFFSLVALLATLLLLPETKGRARVTHFRKDKRAQQRQHSLPRGVKGVATALGQSSGDSELTRPLLGVVECENLGAVEIRPILGVVESGEVGAVENGPLLGVLESGGKGESGSGSGSELGRGGTAPAPALLASQGPWSNLHSFVFGGKRNDLEQAPLPNSLTASPTPQHNDTKCPQTDEASTVGSHQSDSTPLLLGEETYSDCLESEPSAGSSAVPMPLSQDPHTALRHASQAGVRSPSSMTSALTGTPPYDSTHVVPVVCPSSSGRSDASIPLLDTELIAADSSMSRSESEQQPTVWMALCERDTVVAALIFATLTFTWTSHNEVFALWGLSAWSYGGLAFDSSAVGLCQAVGGLSMVPFQLFVYRRVVAWLGPLRTLRCGLIFMMPLVFFPLVRTFTSLSARVLATMAVMVWRSASVTMVFTTCVVLVANSVHLPQFLGAVNGMSQSLNTALCSLAPAAGGAIYAWTISGHNAFPFDFHFYWLLWFLLCCLMLALSLLLSPAIDFRKFEVSSSAVEEPLIV